MKMKLKDRQAIKEAIEARHIPDEMWPLLEQMLQSNEDANRRATDLAWIVEDVSTILKEWSEKQGHDRCWYYPDLFRQMAEKLGMDLKPGPLPPREEFEAGCKRYQDEEYMGS